MNCLLLDSYILNIIIYFGKRTVQQESRGHALSVVHKIVPPNQIEERTINANNYYSSVELAEDIQVNREYLIVTSQNNTKDNTI